MVEIKELSNGLRVVLEEIPYVRSISLGIWVKNGSVNESQQLNGISHYIEHMMFKGTINRTARDIAEEMDAVGGQINAYTTKEYTCYHTRTLDKHFNIALDVLSDMFLNSKFSDSDIKRELNVIIEEINMYEDTPEELVHELLQAEVWKKNSLGMPILGTEKTISTFDHNTLKDYFDKNYRIDNTVISVTGNFKVNEMLSLLEKTFGGWKSKPAYELENNPIEYCKNIFIKKKETEQLHLLLAFPSVRRDDPRKYIYTVFNTIFGGGMSSVLFQKIREEHGLTYSIYSYTAQYSETGLFAIYAGMNPNQAERVLKLIFEEIKVLKENGISETVLKKTKEQIISNFIIGSESTVNRMTSNGGAILLRGKIRTQEEIIDSIEAVTMEDMHKVLNEVFDYSKMSVGAVGKTGSIDFKKIISEVEE
ncbi:MAG: pitrilysin family protein [Lachnospiraceae bacterium]|nr:pitrilysin family protein [Lachnospiraceae bacterium]